MTDIVQARMVVIALALWILINIGETIWAFRKGNFKRLVYSLKNNINNARPLISMLVALYFVFGMVYIMTAVNIWVALQPTSDSLIKNFIIESFPLGIAIFTIAVAMLIVSKGIYPRVKYNDEEKQWAKESEEKFLNSKIGKWLGKIKANKLMNWLIHN